MLNVLKKNLAARSAEKQFEKWYGEHVSRSSNNIRGIFFGFKYIVEVDHHKVYDEFHGFFGWHRNPEFEEKYCYPHRALGDNCLLTTVRGEHTNDETIFVLNEFGGDSVFVGTNSREDALMIALKFK